MKLIERALKILSAILWPKKVPTDQKTIQEGLEEVFKKSYEDLDPQTYGAVCDNDLLENKWTGNIQDPLEVIGERIKGDADDLYSFIDLYGLAGPRAGKMLSRKEFHEAINTEFKGAFSDAFDEFVLDKKPKPGQFIPVHSPFLKGLNKELDFAEKIKSNKLGKIKTGLIGNTYTWMGEFKTTVKDIKQQDNGDVIVFSSGMNGDIWPNELSKFLEAISGEK